MTISLSVLPVLLIGLVAANAALQDIAFPISAIRADEPARSDAQVDVEVQLDVPVDGEIEVALLTRPAAPSPWRMAGLVRAGVSGGRLIVSGHQGVETLLYLRMPGQPGYLLHGPLRWPPHPTTFRVAVRWRRTVRGQLSDPAAAAPAWVGPLIDGPPDTWPACMSVSNTAWECIGVPLVSPGVVVHDWPSGARFGVAPATKVNNGVEHVASRVAAWGRLIALSTPESAPAGKRGAEVQVLARRLHVPRARPQSLRIEEESDNTVRVEPVGRLAYWIWGTDPQTDGWIDVRGEGLATTRLPVRALASGPAVVPLDVRLDAGLTLTGRALAPSGAAAPSTIVALYRLERSERPNEKETTPRRIRIAEAIADAEGMFRFESMAAEPHEIVAFHPALGRSDRSLNGGAEAIEIRLKPFARAVGVVVRNGAAAKGVRVQYVPDLAEFQSSRDPADLRGGDTVTDREGRFSLAVPARGRGEIRVGDEASGIRRIALAPAETRPPVIDLGRIVLDDRPVATLVLEGSDGCEIVLIGPAGRAGMSIVKATRIGPAVFEAAVPESGHWQLAAICGTRERAVLPTMVFIGGTTDRTIRLTWPQ